MECLQNEEESIYGPSAHAYLTVRRVTAPGHPGRFMSYVTGRNALNAFAQATEQDGMYIDCMDTVIVRRSGPFSSRSKAV